MRILGLVLFVCMLALPVFGQVPRLLITTDIGGDPDDQQSLVRLMVYSNEFEIEGLISSASGVPGELKQAVIRPELIKEWMVYPDDNHLTGKVDIKTDKGIASVKMPEMKQGEKIHLVLKVTDDGKPQLTSYKRIILKSK